MVEVRLDEEVWAQGGRLAGVSPATAEALLPLRTGAVRDRCDLAGELHSRVGGHAAVVEAAVPVGVHHEHLALRVAHGDAVRMASRTAADGSDAGYTVWEQSCCGEGLHAAHAGADAGVETVDAEVV